VVESRRLLFVLQFQAQPKGQFSIGHQVTLAAFNGGSNMAYGERLITSLIDAVANEDPSRAWASIPRDDDDLSQGFVDISYKQLANAVNHAAWWLEENLTGERSIFETIAYTGPKDLRYPILAVAASKLGKQVNVRYDCLEAPD